MKKILSVILVLSVAATLVFGSSVFAKDITVELDGKEISFDVKPEIIDGRTMVPLRKIFEEIGANVKWDGETQTISARKNSKTITLIIGSNELTIDKGKTDDEGNPITETVTLEVPAQIVSGRTLVPARAISESFGLNVDWKDSDNKVVITSDDDNDESWKENVGAINLSDLTFEGKGVEIDGNQIKITAGGDFTLAGELEDGNITISTKERVKLRLSGAKITSSKNPCIFVEKADKAFITISKNTENSLVAKESEDGAIYSKENLEIKGSGTLSIESLAGHGIKASDNLNIEEGNIIINAKSDGIHINDTFKMSGGNLDITAIGDGIDSESIINISGGTINIETNGTPIEAPKEEAQETPRRGMWNEAADVEFESSTKGINAEWQMCIAGAEINIDSASHAIHCQDEIQIEDVKMTLSSKYDKGISAHGNLTIDGEETSIDITKATEGIESKNVLTINDGYIKINSTDDALNATGGKSGMMMPGGNFGAGQGNGGAMGGNFRPGRENTGNPQVSTNAPASERPQGNRNPQFGQGTVPAEGRVPQREGNPQGEQDTAAVADNIPQGGRMPQFGQGTRHQRDENGEFTPPENGNRPNGEFTPPENGNRPNGEFTPPENGNRPNGEFTPPANGNRPNGEFTPPANGNRPNGGNMGVGMGRNSKDCLIINGGYIEIYAKDDCIDANGNLVINAGTIKATIASGDFTGNFGILDSDGQITVGEDANLVLVAGSGNANRLNLNQNTIVVNCEAAHEGTDLITLTDADGKVIYEYTPVGGYKAVLIASSNIKTGEKYKITIGSETHEVEIAQQKTVIGTQNFGGRNPMGGGMGMGRNNNRQQNTQK